MDNSRAYGVKNVAPDTTDTTCGGTTPKALAASMTRSGIWIKNHDATLQLWVKLVPHGAAVPTLSNTSNLRVIVAGGTDEIGVAKGVDVYVLNSSGAATLSALSYQDFAF
jgi:hypothetical protein